MAKIARIYDWDEGETLVVPGTDPAQILADGLAAIEEDEVLLTELEEIRVAWWRVLPCRKPCDEGYHGAHWAETSGPTRGGFQAAGLLIGQQEDQ